MRPLGIVEVVRSGRIAMVRGAANSRNGDAQDNHQAEPTDTASSHA